MRPTARIVGKSDDMLRCTVCQQLLSPDKFTITLRRGKRTYESRCKSCSLEYRRELKARVRVVEEINGVVYIFNYNHNENFKRKYGISVEDYVSLIRQQGGSCLLCRKQFKNQNEACLDHCHDTGRVRGVLCRTCNFVMSFVDDEDWMERAKTYKEG